MHFLLRSVEYADIHNLCMSHGCHEYAMRVIAEAVAENRIYVHAIRRTLSNVQITISYAGASLTNVNGVWLMVTTTFESNDLVPNKLQS